MGSCRCGDTRSIVLICKSQAVNRVVADFLECLLDCTWFEGCRLYTHILLDKVLSWHFLACDISDFVTTVSPGL
jgi:hypothetical protein